MALLFLALLAAVLSPAAAGRRLSSAAPSAGPLVAAALAKGLPAHRYTVLLGTYQTGWAVEWLPPLGQVSSCTVAEGKALCDGDPTCGFFYIYDKCCYLMQPHVTGSTYNQNFATYVKVPLGKPPPPLPRRHASPPPPPPPPPPPWPSPPSPPAPTPPAPPRAPSFASVCAAGTFAWRSSTGAHTVGPSQGSGASTLAGPGYSFDTAPTTALVSTIAVNRAAALVVTLCQGTTLTAGSLGIVTAYSLLDLSGVTGSIAIECAVVSQPPACVLDGEQAFQLVSTEGADVSLAGLALRNGHAVGGGAVRELGGSVDAAGDAFTSDTASNGGVSSSSSGGGGGGGGAFGFGGAVFDSGGYFNATGALFVNDSARSSGGAVNVFSGGVMDAAGATFEHDSATYYGGAMSESNSVVYATGTTFESNSAQEV